MSDIHGLYQRYQVMLKEIALKETDHLFVLGDMIDRGPDGIEILQDLMARKNCVSFLGNHEHMMLTYIEGSDRESWFYENNGGRQTYEKFLALDQSEQDRIIEYLRNETYIVKNLSIQENDYILSHTGAFVDGKDLMTKDFGRIMDVQAMVWNMFPYCVEYLGRKRKTDRKKTLISGHIITRRLHYSDEIFVKEYSNGYTWIDIDCGCAAGNMFGYLSCLCIDEDGKMKEVIYVNEKDKPLRLSL